MKTFNKRLVSALLAVIMIAASLCLNVFAGEKSRYTNYTAMGDSNASGFGLNSYMDWCEENSRMFADCMLFDDMYEAYVSDSVGVQNTSIHAFSGWRTTEAIRMLSDDFSFTNCPDEWGNFFLFCLGYRNENEMANESREFKEDVRNADLITVNFGSNDIYSLPAAKIIRDYGYLLGFGLINGELTADVDRSASVLAEKLSEYGGLFEVFANILDAAAAVGKLPQILDTYVKGLYEGLENYKRNIPILIQSIRRINPTAKIVVIGVCNPVSLTGTSVIRIGEMHEVAAELANTYLSKLCPVRDEYVYADITHTDIYGLKSMINTELKLIRAVLKTIHPTEAGQKYIAEQIISAIVADEDAPEVSGSYAKLTKRNTVSWKRVPGAVSYRVYRSESENGEYKLVSVSVGTQYVDLLTKKGRTYYYKVKAVYDIGGNRTSAFGNTVSIKAK